MPGSVARTVGHDRRKANMKVLADARKRKSIKKTLLAR